MLKFGQKKKTYLKKKKVGVAGFEPHSLILTMLTI